MKKYLVDKHDRKIYVGDRLSYESGYEGKKIGTLCDHEKPTHILIDWDDWGSGSVLHCNKFNQKGEDKHKLEKLYGRQQPFVFDG